MKSIILKMKGAFNIIVRDRTKILFQGPTTGVSSKNSKGKFDILLNHANFITVINETLFIHQDKKPDIVIPMNNAILKVRENNIEVYVGVKH